MPSNSYHIAAIGPIELISGLQSVGITTFAATTSEEALSQLRLIRQGDERFACVCITESLMKNINPEDINTKDAESLPVILTIPDLHSSKNAGLDKLRELTKRAIGSDILSD
jgi:V/A-type H+-transporting ATPase subunit F